MEYDRVPDVPGPDEHQSIKHGGKGRTEEIAYMDDAEQWIEREMSDACISSSEREVARPEVKPMVGFGNLSENCFASGNTFGSTR